MKDDLGRTETERNERRKKLSVERKKGGRMEGKEKMQEGKNKVKK